MRTAFAALASFLLLCGAAQAADTCKPSLLVETWLIKTQIGVKCTAAVARSGKLTASTCYSRGKKVGWLTGRATLSKACEIAGRITVHSTSSKVPYKLTGDFNPRRRAFIGYMTRPNDTVLFRADIYRR